MNEKNKDIIVDSVHIRHLMDKWGEIMGWDEDYITRNELKEGMITEEEAFERLI